MFSILAEQQVSYVMQCSVTAALSNFVSFGNYYTASFIQPVIDYINYVWFVIATVLNFTVFHRLLQVDFQTSSAIRYFFSIKYISVTIVASNLSTEVVILKRWWDDIKERINWQAQLVHFLENKAFVVGICPLKPP